MAVLNSIELEGVSDRSWHHAAQEALREASRTLRDIRRLDVLATSGRLKGATMEYRTQVRLTFEVDPERPRAQRPQAPPAGGAR